MIKNQRFINFTLSLVLLTFPSFAEYRLYQYWVKTPERENAELIVSTLDPKSYLAYYGIKSQTTLNLVRSWKCPGFTGGKSFCEFNLSEETINSPAAQPTGTTIP